MKDVCDTKAAVNNRFETSRMCNEPASVSTKSAREQGGDSRSMVRRCVRVTMNECQWSWWDFVCTTSHQEMSRFELREASR